MEALENEEERWGFVDLVCGDLKEEIGHHEEDVLDAALELVSKFFSAGDFLSGRLMKAALELREFAPAVQQQRELGRALLGTLGVERVRDDGSAWVGLAVPKSAMLSTIHGDAEDLQAAIESYLEDLQRPEIAEECVNEPILAFKAFPWDHMHPKSNAVNPEGPHLVAILHGVLGRRDFCEKHKVLVKFAKEMVYMVRWMPGFDGESTKESTPLFGFGVNMDIKNMEYLTIDEDKTANSVTDAHSENMDILGEDQVIDLKQIVQGMNFTKFVEIAPSAQAELESLHSAIAEEVADVSSDDGELQQLKVWEMPGLGLQATAKILSSADPLERWVDLAQNFPSRARSLLKIKVSKLLKRSANSAAKGISVPEGIVFVNGEQSDASSESFNLFTILQSIRREIRISKVLQKFGPEASKVLPKIVTAIIAGGEADSAESMEHKSQMERMEIEMNSMFKRMGARVDVRSDAKGAVIFLNNIEKDKSYSNWSSNLNALLRPSFSFVQVRKNLFTSIAVFDPATQDGRAVMQSMFFIIKNGAPIRFGVVFQDTDDDKEEDVCSAVCFVGLFVTAIKQLGRDAGVAVLEGLARSEDPQLSKDKALDIFATVCVKFTSLVSSTNEASLRQSAAESLESDAVIEIVSKMRAFAKTKGLSVPSWTMNGLVSADLDGFQERLVQQVLQEQRYLAFLVHLQRISVKTNVLKYVLARSNALPRYNKAVLQTTEESEFLLLAPESLPATVTYLGNAPQDTEGITMWLVINDEMKNSDAAKVFETYANDNSGVARMAIVNEAEGEDFKAATIICNGWQVDISQGLQAEDLDLIIEREKDLRLNALLQRLINVEDNELKSPDSIMVLASIAATRAKEGRVEIDFDDLCSRLEGLCYRSGGSDGSVLVQTIIDPLSSAAPRVAAVLKFLRDSLNAKVEFLLKPEVSVSSFPISSYFRYATGEGQGEFANLPQEQLLTLKLSTPEAWIVFPVDTAGLDTDNIQLSRVRDFVSRVSFKLEHILITGHCRESASRAPPAGLQLQLQSAGGEIVADTVVMRNLGYMQLQAGPGVYKLLLAPGKSEELYDFPHEELVVRSFTAEAKMLRFEKRSGMESKNLLDLDEDADEGSNQIEAGWFKWAKDTVIGAGGKKQLQPAKISGTNETIHVFSIASGALYERFLRIMMVSVKKQTSNPVKFWLIENFLSPAFKEAIPTLEAEYGFKVSLVTYKWPHWLRRQTEKQRIIWGYKILFLDVLFPLDVPKVIYVDADQVVRTDLKELWDMDLEGKPYGYTPFCDSRKDTLGFQFWRSGYWKDHLKGKPYHISALYVVDLKNFRKSMVGDRLRGVYDQLSRDPNSLSNLDQDLPNYAQHMVPIFSLPQDWLWCESWCSDESKTTAKTIDLCNNPLRKEPKLSMAKRIISGELFSQGWIELDEEITNVIASDNKKQD